MEEIKHSFAPLLGDRVELLILGSIPGDRSIQVQQYYGHPQNRFWRVMAAILNTPLSVDYTERCQMLLDSHIALWDVASTAHRKGSLDSAIKGEQPNDIERIMAQHPELHTIVFNGRKAEQLYHKYFEQQPHIRYLSLPSTSPANAASSLERLITSWQSCVHT